MNPKEEEEEVRSPGAMSPETLHLFGARIRQLVLYIESFGLPVPAANPQNPQNGVSPTPRNGRAVKEGSSDDTPRANEGARKRSEGAPPPSVASPSPSGEVARQERPDVSPPPPELTSPSVLAFCNRGD